MAQVRNLTPFSVELLVFPDASGQEISLLVISACFTEDSSGLLAPWMPQPPVRVADEHFGDPASSSIRHEADVALDGLSRHQCGARLVADGDLTHFLLADRADGQERLGRDHHGAFGAHGHVIANVDVTVVDHAVEGRADPGVG